jgi:hypothetical protein
MANEKFQHEKLIAISECEICRHLDDYETSFTKYAHEDETELLPAEAARLVRLQGSRVSDTDRREFRRCPICGTFYLYKTTYEYLATGSEDEEELTRATPTQARRFLTDKAYGELIEWMTVNLEHSNPLTRSYAAKCLVSYHLERQEMTAIAQYLRHADVEVVTGALVLLSQFIRDRYKLEACLWELQDPLVELSNRNEELVASYARYVARNISRYAEGAKLEDPGAPVQE